MSPALSSTNLDLGCERRQRRNYGRNICEVSSRLHAIAMTLIVVWTEHGRNLTLLRYPQCTRLVQVGLPNRLRGELWETLSGSLYLRFANPGTYEQILKDNEGKTSTSTEEIEKDLTRSLPEYSAYQTEDGISTLRRVLTAYSWKNPELGYCQAMNILVAAILM